MRSKQNYWYLFVMAAGALACAAVFHGCGTSNGYGIGGKVIVSGVTS